MATKRSIEETAVDVAVQKDQQRVKVAKTDAEWRADWPSEYGEIDLAKHDLPHDSSALEWWYYNTHLKAETGEEFTVFISFFRRMIEGDEEQGFYSSCLWSITDIANSRYYPDSLLDKAAPEVIMAEIESRKDPNTLEKAVYEMCKKNSLPYPDRLMKADGVCEKDRLYLDFDGLKLEKMPNGEYVLDVACPGHNTRAQLTFVPEKKVQRHGATGVVNDMFYYFIPRCGVRGELQIGEKTFKVAGSGWYDHEFGGTAQSKNTVGDAWNWISVQLDDGSDVSIFVVKDEVKQEVKEDVAIVIEKDGSKRLYNNFTFAEERTWTSMQTFMEHAVDWHLSIPEAKLELDVRAVHDYQEFQTVVVGTGGGFWEGRVNASGTKGGVAVKGPGFLERKGFTPYRDTKSMLKSVGKVVKAHLQRVYPTDTSMDFIDTNVLGRHTTPGVAPKDVCDTLFRPVRLLLDRGGKSWRSLILVSAMTAINKYFVDTLKWVVLPELVHVASLIVDDIQDESTIRRGGPCVHLEVGTAHAINAATAVFFMAPELGGVKSLPPAKQLELYHLYMEMLRAGHAGQGLDMLGLDHMMPSAVETGDNTELLARLDAIHKLKTGGPAGSLCRMATLIVDGTPEQADALEAYGLSLGLAFQIVDDALNLRGFEGDLKEVGEDIRDGKITYPVVLALPKLNKKDRTWLWELLKEHTSDKEKIKKAIALLDKVGSIDESLQCARDIVNSAWEKVDPFLVDSLPKLMMRSFGMYLVDRTW